MTEISENAASQEPDFIESPHAYDTFESVTKDDLATE
jgi:hypothetical protein